MKWPVLILAILLGCASEEKPATPAPAPKTAAPAPKPAAPAKPKSDAEKTVADIAVGSPDHTTLVKALQAAGLVDALASPGGIYTVFAPTNAAFEKLPPGTVEGLLKPEKKDDLRKILQHHAAVPIKLQKDMKDGEQMPMSDGSKVTFHVSGDTVKVDEATILGSVSGVNGIVYVVDTVILPPG